MNLQIFPIKEKLNRELKFVRFLEVFEGPILTEYHAANGGSYYVEKFCVRLNGVSRFLITRTEPRAIAEYLALKISLRDLILNFSDGGCYIVDKDANGEILESYYVRYSELPSLYMPENDSFHDLDLRPDWEKTSQSFLINEQWNAKLLAKLERNYLSVTALLSFASVRAKKRLPDSIFTLEYDGGFPIMHMYNTLLDVIPFENRARCVGVAAASPGILTLNSPTEIVKDLRISIESFNLSKDLYSQVQSWAKTKPSDADGIGSAATTFSDLEVLCTSIGLHCDSLFPAPTSKLQYPKRHKPSILTAGKIATAYYRSLERLQGGESDEYTFVG